MKTFSLLWFDGRGRNISYGDVRANNGSEADKLFSHQAPGLINGYQKLENGAAWIVCEKFE